MAKTRLAGDIKLILGAVTSRMAAIQKAAVKNELPVDDHKNPFDRAMWNNWRNYSRRLHTAIDAAQQHVDSYGSSKYKKLQSAMRPKLKTARDQFAAFVAQSKTTAQHWDQTLDLLDDILKAQGK